MNRLELFSPLELEKWVGGKRFVNNDEVECAIDACLEDPDDSHYKQGISKRIELNGDRGEKEIVSLQFFCIFLVTSGAVLVFWCTFS